MFKIKLVRTKKKGEISCVYFTYNGKKTYYRIATGLYKKLLQIQNIRDKGM
jgi:hypothetical protein